MKTLIRIVITGLLLASVLAACSMGASPASQQDAVDTAVAGTHVAEALAQATVNANALTAMPATTPTPGPPVEYVTLTEEELAALIDETVAEAVTATEQTTTAVTTSTSDGTVTSEEVAYMYPYYYNADYYVAYAEELLYVYDDLYGELADEMVYTLQLVDETLMVLNDTLVIVADSLETINSSLEQGLELAEDSIAQLESAAQQAQAQVATLQEQRSDIMTSLQTDQQNRLDAISQIQPDNVPSDRISALQSGFQFLDFANSALTDEKLSRDELMGLAQLGANAQAGFQNFGGPGAVGPDLSQFSGRFNEINTQFARGEVPKGRDNLHQFELSLGERPSLPGGGGGPSLPGGGGGPSLPGGGNGPSLPSPRN